MSENSQSSSDLGMAAAARVFAASCTTAKQKDQALMAAAVLCDHGVYAMFRSCARMKGAEPLATKCLEVLQEEGFRVEPCGGEDACKQVQDQIATDLRATFRAHRLLTRFLDYVYIHIRDGAR